MTSALETGLACSASVHPTALPSSRKASKVAQDEIESGLVEYIIEEKPVKPLIPAEGHFDGGSR